MKRPIPKTDSRFPAKAFDPLEMMIYKMAHLARFWFSLIIDKLPSSISISKQESPLMDPMTHSHKKPPTPSYYLRTLFKPQPAEPGPRIASVTNLPISGLLGLASFGSSLLFCCSVSKKRRPKTIIIYLRPKGVIVRCHRSHFPSPRIARHIHVLLPTGCEGPVEGFYPKSTLGYTCNSLYGDLLVLAPKLLCDPDDYVPVLCASSWKAWLICALTSSSASCPSRDTPVVPARTRNWVGTSHRRSLGRTKREKMYDNVNFPCHLPSGQRFG